MGNTIRTLALCDCFFPNDYEEEVLFYKRNHQESSRSRRVNTLPIKSCDIFTITSVEPAYEFIKSSNNRSLNDIRLSSELLDTNLTKISSDLSSSFCSIDSGFGNTIFSSTSVSPSQENDFELIAINLETISQYSFKSYDSILSRQAPVFDVLYTSLFNFTYFLNKPFSKLLSKRGLKQAIFSSEFITAMKERIDKRSTRKIKAPIKNVVENNSTELVSSIADTEDISSSSSYSSNFVQKGYSQLLANFNGLNSLRKLASKIYDVNYF